MGLSFDLSGVDWHLSRQWATRAHTQFRRPYLSDTPPFEYCHNALHYGSIPQRVLRASSSESSDSPCRWGSESFRPQRAKITNARKIVGIDYAAHVSNPRFMEKCKFCGIETELCESGIPICPKCADDYEQLVKRTLETKPGQTLKSEPDESKREGSETE